MFGRVLRVQAQFPRLRPAIVVFHFLRRLPEEQVRADGRAQYRNHHRRVIFERGVFGEE